MLTVIKVSQYNSCETTMTLDEAVKELESYNYWKSDTIRNRLLYFEEIWTTVVVYKLSRN